MGNFKIIHLCKYYDGSKVHLNFVKSIMKISKYKQIIFICSDSHSSINKAYDGIEIIRIHYPKFLKYFPLTKSIYVSLIILKKYRNIFKHSYTYAHTLWADGSIAYIVSRFSFERYSIIVRNTDINFYLRFFPTVKLFSRVILKRAHRVGFVSKAYLLKCLHIKEFKNVINNFYLWPNGAELTMPVKKNRITALPTILFVGVFNKNKNLKNVVLSCIALRNKGINLKLICVGGTILEFSKAIGLNSNHYEWILVEGRVPHDKITAYYDMSSCLVVPSYRETFGLVYLEALSRGCPVIFSNGEAIDGFFKNDPMCIGVQPDNLLDIENAISLLLKTPFKFHTVKDLAKFNWKNISEKILIDCNILVKQ